MTYHPSGPRPRPRISRSFEVETVLRNNRVAEALSRACSAELSLPNSYDLLIDDFDRRVHLVYTSAAPHLVHVATDLLRLKPIEITEPNVIPAPATTVREILGLIDAIVAVRDEV